MNKLIHLTKFSAWLLTGLLCISSPALLAKTSQKASQDIRISQKRMATKSTKKTLQKKSLKSKDAISLASTQPSAHSSNINPKVMQLALTAQRKAQSMGLPRKQILTVIDYSLPSTARRLWVVDMIRNKVIYNAHVAHGSGTGDNHAKHFSDSPGSHKSSLGLFLTGSTYKGKHGTSLKLHGLEQGINGNAASRAIVIHPAGYVSDNYIKSTGRLGRSWGCPALSYSTAAPIIQTIKEGSLVFAYYPDNKWLSRSKFL